MPNYALATACQHGLGIAAIICIHQLNSPNPVGFVEISSEPNDLQAWCFACEYMFEMESGKTEKFLRFNSAVVVCDKCYEKSKTKHAFD